MYNWVDKNIHKSVNLLITLLILGLNGAQGRNRTTDTKIFNGGGINYIFINNSLRGDIFGVRISVFLVSFLGQGENVVLNTALRAVVLSRVTETA